jgi:hypothetical protein
VLVCHARRHGFKPHFPCSNLQLPLARPIWFLRQPELPVRILQMRRLLALVPFIRMNPIALKHEEFLSSLIELVDSTQTKMKNPHGQSPFLKAEATTALKHEEFISSLQL